MGVHDCIQFMQIEVNDIPTKTKTSVRLVCGVCDVCHRGHRHRSKESTQAINSTSHKQHINWPL